MKLPIALLTSGALSLATCLSQTLTTGPSTTVAPYLDSHLPGVTIKSLLTVGDGTTVPKTGGGTTRLIGICDGLGGYDNGNGTFTLLLNHEITSTQGIVRDHGSIGSFVSKWVIDKTTHEVISGDDLINEVFNWTGAAYSATPTATAFDRLCSADLPPLTATFNANNSLGSQERIFMNGEETSGGKAYAHVVSGPDAGKSYHLAHFGYTSFENVVLCPKEQDKTIAIMTNDSGDGEVFVYVGTKNNSGTTEPEKAGLTGGSLYGIKVEGKPFELAADASLAVDPLEDFVLGTIGTPGDYPTTGTDTNNRATTAGVLQMGGPEDGAWDNRPGMENNFYFVTKGTSSNGINAPTRIWKLSFTDISQPDLGGTLHLLLDGPANRLGSLDNLTFEDGKLLIQEDLGDDERLSKIWEYDTTTGKLEEVAQHRGNSFYPGGANFLTTNEESSGIIPLTDILGAGWYAAAVQVHSNTHIAAGDRTELVEGGQLILLNLAARDEDLSRDALISHGDTWKYEASGTDPGATWKDAGFNDAAWLSGPSMLGYGDDVETQTDIPAPANPKPAAAYFRKTFDLATPADVILLDLYMKYDDGAVVYINGVEVSRANMNRTTAVTNSTFATVNEPAERDWKHLSIPCENLNLQTTGNVIAVSIHQENATSSDTRMDLELFSWTKSPDTGTAPTTPVGLAVGTPLDNSLEVSWTAQAGVKFFRLERKLAGELTWQVVADEIPGNFTSLTNSGLAPGSDYSYRLWAVNQYGASTCTAPVSGMTTSTAAPVIFFEDFSTTANTTATAASPLTTTTGIKTVSVTANRNWYVGGPFGTIGKVANGNGFGSSPAGTPSDDWLLLPPLNTHFLTGETLSFVSDARFNDNGLTQPVTGPQSANTGLDVLVSTDYNPAVHTDPGTATWTLLNSLATFDTDFNSFGGGVPSGNVDLSPYVGGAVTVAYRYRSSGTISNAARHWEITDLQVAGECNLDIESTLAPLTAYSSASSLNWTAGTVGARNGARANNFGADAPGDDWLITPSFATVFDNMALSFDYFERFGDTGSLPQGKPLAVLISTDHTDGADPSLATWTDITPTGLNGSVSNAWRSVTNVPLGLTGTNWNVHVAFRYQSSGTGSNGTKQIGIDNLCIKQGGGPLTVDFTFAQVGSEATFTPTVSGGTEPYTFSWDFGDDSPTSNSESPGYVYTNGASYTAILTVTDAEGTVVNVNKEVSVNYTDFTVPAPNGDVRIATFNAAMNSDDINGNAGDANALGTALANGNHPAIRKVAEVIQRVNPDIILLNEFDLVYSGQTLDEAATLARVNLLRSNYLEVSQQAGLTSVQYPYQFIGGTNTGLSSGFDLRNNGSVDNSPGDQTYGDDAFGFGQFPGKYGFIVLSKYPIDAANARTFQKFLWKDMPDALLPEDPNDTDGDNSTTNFYTTDELNVFRLSSKSHWDVPVIVNGEPLHLLCSHPTPPVFDDGETLTHMLKTGTPATKADWNGLRNNDEIRFWADYVDPDNDDYIYDDTQITLTGDTDSAGNALYTGNPSGGLGANKRFVILGDLNADPVDGDSSFEGSNSLIGSSFVDAALVPESTGALQQVSTTFNNEASKTSSFNLRADFLLPSTFGFDPLQTGVYWPLTGDATYYLLGASDHRSVWMDLDISEVEFLVSSGDVTFTTAMLWARPNVTGDVEFKIATDESLTSVVTTATVSSTDLKIPVKTMVSGLSADTEYFYEATSSNGGSARGRFVTPPTTGFNGISFGVSGDWRGELTPYPAIANVDEFNLDFFVQLGDTIYADDASPASARFTNPEQAATIGEFRAKHAEGYSSDQFGLGSNNWADLRASTSIFAAIDDHEVANDFAGYQTVASDSRFTDAFPDESATYINESELYRNGLQSFAEYNPIRDETYSGTGDARFDGKPKLYRNQTFGKDMQMTVLDTRSFRDQAIAPPADFTDTAQVTATYVATFTPGRTILGSSQLDDLKADLLQAQADGITWKFVSIPEPIQEIFPGVQTDTIASYALEKAELLRFIDDNNLTNVVFVAADVHTTFVNNLTWQDSPGGEIKASKAWEITTGSVAYDLPTGEFLAGLAISTLPPEQQAGAAAFYSGLPLAPDTDDLVNDKDDFVKDAINKQLLDPFGFDHLGLNDNLPQADGLIDATLVQGDYFVGHTYGWTKFDIDPETQILTVTTYGMDAYRETEILDPQTRAEVLARPLQIVSQFTVRPQEEILPEFKVVLADDTTLISGSSQLEYGSLDLGDSFEKLITVVNIGTVDLPLDDVTLVGAHAADFSIGTIEDEILAPGARTAFTVTFTPTATGARTASLKIVSESVDSPFTVALRGAGAAPVEPPVTSFIVNLGNQTLMDNHTNNFGKITVGKTSKSLVLTIKNNGTATLSQLMIALTGEQAKDFIIVQQPASSVAPGASTQFQVAYKPGKAGTSTATLQISNAESGDNLFDIGLTGKGVAPEIKVLLAQKNLKSKKSEIKFGDVLVGEKSKIMVLTVKNDGSAPLENLKISLKGKMADEFAVLNKPAKSLAPGKSTKVKLMYLPTKAKTSKVDLLIGSNDADENPFRLLLTGKGLSE